MCNFLHKNSKKIPKSGDGWKIFFTSKNGVLSTLFCSLKYRKSKDCWIKWKPRNVYLNEEKRGFCFFLTKRTADKAIRLFKKYNNDFYGNCYIFKIKYNEGLGTHLEDGMIYGHRITIAICKQFKVVG